MLEKILTKWHDIPREVRASSQVSGRMVIPESIALGSNLLLYSLAVVVLATLAPYRFAWPESFALMGFDTARDVVLNVVLFLVPGYLYQMAACRSSDRLCARALIAGLVFSAAIEMVQVFLPGRHTSFVDLATNGLGAWLGALAYQRAGAVLNRRLRGKLTLELPLMCIPYLLTPLMWLSGITSRGAEHALVIPALGLLGVCVFISVWANREPENRPLSASQLVLVATGWFVVASLPSALRAPGFAVLSAVTIAAIAYGLISLRWLEVGSGPRRPASRERRFERRTVIRLIPIFGLYLIALALRPWTGLTSSWQFSIGLSSIPDALGTVEALAVLESVAAFTVMGYLIAELRTRTQDPVWLTQLAVGLIGFVLAGAVNATRGFHVDHNASLLMQGFMTGAALFGAAIYRSHLALVIRITNARRAARGKPAPSGRLPASASPLPDTG